MDNDIQVERLVGVVDTAYGCLVGPLIIVSVLVVVYHCVLAAKVSWAAEQQRYAEQRRSVVQEPLEESEEEQEEETVPAKFASMMDIIKEEQEKTRRVQEVVYQLLGGLYNQDTQRKTRDYHVDVLYNRVVSEGMMDVADGCDYYSGDTGGTYPTTRQGDETDECLISLFKITQKQAEWIAALEKKEKTHQEQIDRIEASVNRLVSGLYDEVTQDPVRNVEQDLLSGIRPADAFAFAGLDEKCDIYPTTQQGYRLEKRLANLEALLGQQYEPAHSMMKQWPEWEDLQRM